MRKYVIWTFVISLLMGLYSCQKEEVENPQDDPVVTKITTEHPEYVIKKGESLTINVLHTPSDLPSPQYKLSIENTKVLSKGSDSELEIVGTEVGESKVTIMTTGGVFLTTRCNIIVEPIDAESIKFDETLYEMKVGDEVQLHYSIEPLDATYQDVEWSIEDESVASVSEDGVVRALSLGETKVIARLLNSDLYAQCVIIVNPTPVTSIETDVNHIELLIGKQATINAQVYPTDATCQDLIWSSSDESIATVNEMGVVEAVGIGYAIIRVESVDGESFAEVTVSVCDIDDFVEGDIGFAIRVGSGYMIYQLYLIVSVSNGEYIDIESIKLYNQIGKCIDEVTDIGSCDSYTMNTYLTNGNTQGCYYILKYSYNGKVYEKLFYNY